jgi:acyl carrier protein
MSYSAADIQAWMVSHLAELLGVETDEVDIHENLENYGLDSAQAMTLVSKLEELLGFQPSPLLLWHYPNIASLSERLAEELAEQSDVQDTGIVKQTSGNAIADIPTLDLQAEAVLDPTIHPGGAVYTPIDKPKKIFLTGSTGFLGAFIIRELLEQTDAELYCLVRASSLQEGKNKLHKNLEQYGIGQNELNPRIIPVIGDLSQPC